MKRITSVILCLVMIMSIFPASFIVYANEIYIENNTNEYIEIKEDKEIKKEQLSNVIIIVEKSYNQGDTFEIFEVITIEDLPVGSTYNYNPFEFDNFNLITTEDLSVLVDEDTNKNVIRVRYIQIEAVQDIPNSVINIFEAIENILDGIEEPNNTDDIDNKHSEIEIDDDIVNNSIGMNHAFNIRYYVEPDNNSYEMEQYILTHYPDGNSGLSSGIIREQDPMHLNLIQPYYQVRNVLYTAPLNINFEFRDERRNKDHYIVVPEQNVRFNSTLQTVFIYTEKANLRVHHGVMEGNNFRVLRTDNFMAEDLPNGNPNNNEVLYEHFEHYPSGTPDTANFDNLVYSHIRPYVTGTTNPFGDADSRSVVRQNDRLGTMTFSLGNNPRYNNIAVVYDRIPTSSVQVQTLKSYDRGATYQHYRTQTINDLVVGSTYTHRPETYPNFVLTASVLSTSVSSNANENIITLRYKQYGDEIILNHGWYNEEGDFELLYTQSIDPTKPLPTYLTRVNTAENHFVYNHFNQFPSGTPNLEVFETFNYRELKAGYNSHVTTHDNDLGIMGIKFIDNDLNYYSNEINIVYDKVSSVEVEILKSDDRGKSFEVYDNEIIENLIVGSTYTYIPKEYDDYLLTTLDLDIVVDENSSMNKVTLKYVKYYDEAIINHGFYNENEEFEILYTHTIDFDSNIEKSNVPTTEFIYNHFDMYANGVPDMYIFDDFKYLKLQGGENTNILSQIDEKGLIEINLIDESFNFYSNEIRVVYTNKDNIVVNTIYGYFANDKFIEVSRDIDELQEGTYFTLNPLNSLDDKYSFLYWTEISGILDSIDESDFDLKIADSKESNVIVNYNNDLVHNFIVVYDKIYADIEIVIKKSQDRINFNEHKRKVTEKKPVGTVYNHNPLNFDGFVLYNPEDTILEVDNYPDNNIITLFYVAETNDTDNGGGSGDGDNGGGDNGNGDNGDSGGDTKPPSITNPPTEGGTRPPNIIDPPTENIIAPPSIINPPADLVITPPSETILPPTESIVVPPTSNPPSENSPAIQNVTNGTPNGGNRVNNTGNNHMNINSQNQMPSSNSIDIETVDSNMQRELIYEFLSSFLSRFNFSSNVDLETTTMETYENTHARVYGLNLLSSLLTKLLLLALLSLPFVGYILLKSNVKVYAKNEETQEFELVSKVRVKNTELDLAKYADKYNQFAIELSDRFIDKFEGEDLTIKTNDNIINNLINSKYKTEAIEISI